ncbi:hypothetical protein SAMN04488058_110107 [Deinococcus reticulitermitis]|uniref:Beta-glucosidase/6-phospho-beta-glucosidase/beta-galactosidase n=1 Tax=Deinococcus reticulitermitis TaxID=856736 RepID=A0A1H7A183_9DEIO|nr:hypothetical protein [Deinococcus reticulitermitis]SEJ55752.1 hypothetical protein SAMN04488058_110107 [Deinococcus reticulitermitis]
MQRPLFQSFLMGGFECSTHRRPSGRRVDVIDATGHDRFALADYRRLAHSGLRTARDGLRWHLIERRPGEYDFLSAEGQVLGARQAGVQVIWDLMHYGFPDFVDVFSPEFPGIFARYARAAAEFLRVHTTGTLWVCPINEISFASWAGGEVGYFNPCATGRGPELKRQLVRAAVAAMRAVRGVDPGARFLHAEPLIRVHPVPDQDPFEALLAHEGQFETLDLLLGRREPELGGAEDLVDVVGVNYYPYNQWRHHPDPAGRETVHFDHPDHQPLHELLREVHARFGRPLLISETGAEDAARVPWFEAVRREVDFARRSGIPVEGLCLYPIVNHPGWDDDRHCHNGVWDYADAAGERPGFEPLLRLLHGELSPVS